jgi:hypothetical protein
MIKALQRNTANGTDGISHVFRSVKRTGDNEESSDEVMAASTTPGQSEKQGHDVSGGGPDGANMMPVYLPTFHSLSSRACLALINLYQKLNITYHGP